MSKAILLLWIFAGLAAISINAQEDENICFTADEYAQELTDGLQVTDEEAAFIMNQAFERTDRQKENSVTGQGWRRFRRRIRRAVRRAVDKVKPWLPLVPVVLPGRKKRDVSIYLSKEAVQKYIPENEDGLLVNNAMVSTLAVLMRADGSVCSTFDDIEATPRSSSYILLAPFHGTENEVEIEQ